MIYTADSENRGDGVGAELTNRLNVSLPILSVSRVENYIFNEQVLELEGKEYCLINWSELGWNRSLEHGHTWGINTKDYDFMQGDEWEKLDRFVVRNQPKISLVRDLLIQDIRPNVLPISYPCFLPEEPMQLAEDFNRRPFEVLFAWGLSHEYRKTLHSLIWSEAGKYGYSVLDNIYHIKQFVDNESNKHKWFTVNIPWYSRIPMKEFIKINGLAKISISIAGQGRGCFRHAESPVNSAMLMWDENIAWNEGMEWIHGVNCIKCKQGDEIETLIEWLNNPNLYSVYLAGMQNVQKYRFTEYVPYLEKIINEA